MSGLNGWQRIWVVLMAVWLVPVAYLASHNPPQYDAEGSTPDFRVSKRMPTTAWWGSDCKGHELTVGWRRPRDGKSQEWTGQKWRVVEQSEIAAELRRDHPDVYGGLTNEQVIKKMNEFFDDWEPVPDSFVPDPEYVKAHVPNSDAHLALCFEPRISDAEMNRILTEHATDYRSAWRWAMAEHMGIGALLWLIPGLALYGLGWSVGWIRRGFAK